MSTDLDYAIKSAVSDIVAAAPDVTDDPAVVLITPTVGATPRRLLLAAAAVLVVVAGVTGIALASRGSPSQTGPAATEQPITPAPTDPESQPTGPATTVDPAQPCSDGTGQTTAPNVAGMHSEVAVDMLTAAGLGFEVVREVSADGKAPVYEYVVARQHTAPGELLACGTVVVLTVADRPMISYEIQPGDTWESIAAAQGVIVEDLLDTNGLTVAALEATGESVASPLDPGRTITILLPPTLETAPPTTPAASDGDPTTTLATECLHTVVEGDNPERVAAMYGLTVEALAAANANNPNWQTFLIGRDLIIPLPEC